MRPPGQQPTQQRLNELFTYDAATGELRARKKLPHRPIGKVIGNLNQAGYLCVEVDSYQERVHRLVWIMHHGPIPPLRYIDHIDRRRANNRIENLRLVTTRENMRNTGLHSRNTSGTTGVFFDKGKWNARLSLYLGGFDDKDSAIAARRIAKHKLDKLFDEGALQ